MSVMDIDPSMDAASFAKAMQELRRVGSLPWEGVHLRKDGSAMSVEGTLTYVHGERERVEAVLYDTAEQQARGVSEYNRFRTFVEQAPIAVIVSRCGVGIYANRAFGQMFGVSTSVGMPIADIIAPDFREEVAERTRRRSQGLQVSPDFETLGIRADGSTFEIRIAVRSVDLPGETANIAFITDISRQKRSEAALVSSESRLKAILENSTDAIGVHVNGIWEMCNPAALRLFGYESEEGLMGTSVLGTVAPSERSRIGDSVQKRLRGEEVPWEYLTRGLRADGTEFDMEIRSSAFSLDGRLHVLVIGRDVTERRMAERSLQESEERFRRLFEDSPIGIVFLGKQREITLTNHAYRDFVGLTEAEIKERGPVGILHPEDWTPSLENSEKLRSGEAPLFHMEQRHIRGNGAIAWADTHITVVRTSHSEVGCCDARKTWLQDPGSGHSKRSHPSGQGECGKDRPAHYRRCDARDEWSRLVEGTEFIQSAHEEHVRIGLHRRCHLSSRHAR